MATGKLLRKLIRAGTEGDPDAFRDVSEEVIRHERQKQHHLLANDLERILYGTPKRESVAVRRLNDSVPKDAERGLPLIEVKEPCRDLEDVILSEENHELVDRILREKRRQDVLSSYGLRPIEKMLFCGPPGCGKTLTAEVIATELSMPLAIIRIDSVVSSYLGETSANLRKVFEFVEEWEVVALFDEFDAIAKERSDSTEHGELHRVVNAFLQMADSYRGDSLLIAATNHEGVLDRAIWRRFEELLVFDLPTPEEARRLLTVKLRGVRREFEPEDVPVSEWFDGMSYADIERVVLRAVKNMALEGKEFLSMPDLKSALDMESARQARISKIGEQ
jgi:SpoVK/Ycf46/Vps4 family AAA+-type ATPase